MMNYDGNDETFPTFTRAFLLRLFLHALLLALGTPEYQ